MHVYGKTLTFDFPGFKGMKKNKGKYVKLSVAAACIMLCLKISTFSNCLNKTSSSVFTDHLKYRSVWFGWFWRQFGITIGSVFWKSFLFLNASTAAVCFYCQSSWGVFSKLTPWTHCRGDVGFSYVIIYSDLSLPSTLASFPQSHSRCKISPASL